MRRKIASLVVLLLAAGLVVPASGLGAEKSTYRFFECYGTPDFSHATVWFSGEDGTVMHARGVTNHNVTWVWGQAGWTMAGTNDVYVNLNMDTVSGRANQWGTNTMRLVQLGDFEGAWTWGNVSMVAGRSTMTGIGDDEGKLAKGWLFGPATPDGWTPGPVAGCTGPAGYGYFQLEIIDTQG